MRFTYVGLLHNHREGCTGDHSRRGEFAAQPGDEFTVLFCFYRQPIFMKSFHLEVLSRCVRAIK